MMSGYSRITLDKKQLRENLAQVSREYCVKRFAYAMKPVK